jgi:predicted nucleic acid-binding protein
MIYALDTNILIDCINNETAVLARLEEALNDNLPMVIPTIVEYEVIRGFRHTPNKLKEAHYTTLRQFIPLVEMNDDIWARAAFLWATLRKTGKSIGDADIIIAAHCLVSNYILVTHNTSDFEGVIGLTITDWQV